MAGSIVFSAKLPDGLLDQIADELNLTEGETRDELIEKLQRMADIYVLGRQSEEWWGTPGPQRTVLRALAKQLDRTMLAMNRIKVDYAQALNRFAKKPAGFKGPSDVTRRARDAITDLGSAIRQFDARYKPRTSRAADLTLEDTVRGLMAVIHSATGVMPHPKMNKHAEKQPSLEAPGARAMGTLLRELDPSLREVTIANMMLKVRSQKRRSESHFYALYGIDPNAEVVPAPTPPRPLGRATSPATTADYCAYFGIQVDSDTDE